MIYITEAEASKKIFGGCKIKKAIIGVTTALLTLIMCMALAGCATKVKGKTYVYDSYEISYTDDVTDEQKTACEKVIEVAMVVAKNIKYEFKDDGTVTAGIGTYKYEQDGKDVILKLKDAEVKRLTVSGKKLKTTQSAEDMHLTDVAGVKSVTVIYKQA